MASGRFAASDNPGFYAVVPGLSRVDRKVVAVQAIPAI